MAGTEHGHTSGNRIYFLAWFWLLVLMGLKVAVVSVSMPRTVMVATLLVLLVLKVFLITAYFMHLRFERVSLVILAVTPLILGLMLYFGVAPDFITGYGR